MKKTTNSSASQAAALRKKAEKQKAKTRLLLPEVDVQKLLHELEVCQ